MLTPVNGPEWFQCMVSATQVPVITLSGRDNAQVDGQAESSPVLRAIKRTVYLEWSGRASLRWRHLSEGDLDTSEHLPTLIQ